MLYLYIFQDKKMKKKKNLSIFSDRTTKRGGGVNDRPQRKNTFFPTNFFGKN